MKFRGIVDFAACLVTVSVVLLMVARVTWANAVDDLLPGHWLEVSDSRLESHDPEDDPAANPNWPGAAPWRGFEGQAAVINDWSSAAYDTQRGRLAIWGGGHGGYAGNEVYVFDVETLLWERVTNPSIDVIPNGTTLYNDGEPRARETYNYLEYVPAIDRMISFGGANLYPCCNVTTDLASFDFDALDWDTASLNAHPGSPFAMFETVAAVDQLTSHVWLAQPGNNPVHEYDPVANTWASHSRNDTLRFRNAAIDQRNRYLIWMGSSDDTIAFDLDNPTFFAIPRATTGDTEIELASYPGMAWDPVSERIIAWGDGASVYALDSDTWEWARIDPDPANTVVPTAPNSNGTNGRFRYVPEKNAFILVNRVSDNVYFYKLPSGTVDTDGDGVADNADNCLLEPNGPTAPDAGGNVQLDTDDDGIGNACDGDIAGSNDCVVNFPDLNVTKDAFFSAVGLPGWNPDADHNGDGSVNFIDLNVLKAHFFRDYTADNPSGLPNDCGTP